MKIITSQNYINEEIVNNYIDEMLSSGAKEITLPVINIYYDDLYILADGHHRYMAAKSIGTIINFEIVEDQKTYYKYVENENTDEILNAWYMDTDYHYLDTGLSVF